jgi:peptidoglycan/xylan/chitin deacetylase (PgdA/CDA1 family)
MHCENHPDRQAVVRCQYCWKAICSDCQVRVKDQFFCSQHCSTLFRNKNFRLRSQQVLFKHNLYIRSKIDHINKYSTFLLILIGLSVGLILLHSATTEERHSPVPAVFPSTAKKDFANGQNDTALSQMDPATGQNNSMTVQNNPGAHASVDAYGAAGSMPGERALQTADSQAGSALSPLAKNNSAGNPNSLSDPNNAAFLLKDTLARGAAFAPSASQEQICSDFLISLAPHSSQQPSYIVDVCGSAPPNSIIALYKNDRLCDTVPCRGNQFLFARIGLEKNKNILQAKLITADGNFCYSNSLELFVDVATSQVLEKGLDFRRGNLNQAKICLSFDSGESADEASAILDILKEKNVQTTIFLTGEFIRRNPKIVRRIIADGHEVGNHTDTHPHLTRVEGHEIKSLSGVTREFLQHELKKAESAFYYATGKHMSPYWRAPYGESNLEIRKWAEELGYIHVAWTCGRAWEDGLDSLDWVANTDSIKYHTAEKIRNQIINFGSDTEVGANGGIVLMHFSTSRPRHDEVYLQLPGIIDGLREKGYEIVKISGLLQGMSGQELARGIKRRKKRGRARHAGAEDPNSSLESRLR